MDRSRPEEGSRMVLKFLRGSYHFSLKDLGWLNTGQLQVTAGRRAGGQTLNRILYS
jgi:hypothetical protein